MFSVAIATLPFSVAPEGGSAPLAGRPIRACAELRRAVIAVADLHGAVTADAELTRAVRAIIATRGGCP